MRRTFLLAALLGTAVLAAVVYKGMPTFGQKEPSGVRELSTSLMDRKGKTIGHAVLTQVPGGVKIRIEAAHLNPGKHGFHIHETGKCEAPDFQSAGAHLNPEHKLHGFHNPKGYHLGDLPNLKVGSGGKAEAEFVAAKATLEKGKPGSLLKEGGTALIIHENTDDYATDPSGNSGSRVACGVIR